MDATTKKKIIDHYEKGQGSIQDIARTYNVSVAAVLDATGQGSLSSVHTQGDLIDESDAGPGAQMNYGKTFTVPFTTD
jgi:hypothetical protein